MTIKELIEKLKNYPSNYIVRDDTNGEIIKIELVDSGYYALEQDYIMLKTTYNEKEI